MEVLEGFVAAVRFSPVLSIGIPLSIVECLVNKDNVNVRKQFAVGEIGNVFL